MSHNVRHLPNSARQPVSPDGPRLGMMQYEGEAVRPPCMPVAGDVVQLTQRVDPMLIQSPLVHLPLYVTSVREDGAVTGIVMTDPQLRHMSNGQVQISTPILPAIAVRWAPDDTVVPSWRERPGRPLTSPGHPLASAGRPLAPALPPSLDPLDPA